MFVQFVDMINCQKNRMMKTGTHLMKYVHVVVLNMVSMTKVMEIDLKNIAINGLKKE